MPNASAFDAPLRSLTESFGKMVVRLLLDNMGAWFSPLGNGNQNVLPLSVRWRRFIRFKHAGVLVHILDRLSHSYYWRGYIRGSRFQAAVEEEG
jgi:hypothetical protein